MIGEYRESELHRQLKYLYAERYRGSVEQQTDGYVVDVAAEDQLIEIQTANFSHIVGKFRSLLKNHRVRLIYPLVIEKQLQVLSADGSVLRERKAPLRPHLSQAGSELMRICEVAGDPNLTVEILQVRILERRIDDGTGSWRRKGLRIASRTLLETVDSIELQTIESYTRLLPEGLPRCFTNRMISQRAGIPVTRVRKLTWFLRRIGAIEPQGKLGREIVYILKGADAV